MKSKFKIKATCKDDIVAVEVNGTVSDLLTGLRCITRSLVTDGDIPAELITLTVKNAIKEASRKYEHT